MIFAVAVLLILVAFYVVFSVSDRFPGRKGKK